jgi:hypothetical protein
MGQMTAAAAAMRSKFEAEVLAEVARVGVDAFRPDALVKRYVTKGGGKATLYRWAKAVLTSGRAEAHVERIAAQVMAARAEVDPEPAVGAAVDATKAVIAGEHVVRGTGGAGAMALLEKLHDCIKTAEDVLAHAKTPEGKVRNSKLMLQAGENLRRCIETGARVAEMLVNAAEVERYHAVIFDCLKDESPALAERIVLRLQRVNSQYLR